MQTPMMLPILLLFFNSLPVEWPVQPHQFGLNNLEMVFEHEVDLWKHRASESHAFSNTI